MNNKIELLAPGGDINAMKTAILAGADAIYCGLNKFNARNRAANISFEDLQGILRVAHEHQCEVFLTLNIVIQDSEIPALIKLLNRLVNTSIDGLIVQDFGLFYLISKHFPTFRIHASTQLTTHNEGQIKFLSALNAERVNLSRELSITEIKDLTTVAHQEDVKVEVFVHGSYCISFSGLCYMSSLLSGNSGNRGQCSQPCRERYATTATGHDYPLNLKDNSAYLDYKELHAAGVDSLKIEGRIKESEYVYTTVKAWRQQIDGYASSGHTETDNSALYKVFNRDFSDGFLKGNIDKDMFIDNPMNHAITYLNTKDKSASEEEKEKQQNLLLQEKSTLRDYINQEIEGYDSSQQALSIEVAGQCDSPLVISITTPTSSFDITSAIPLADTGTEVLTESILLKRLRAIEDTEYYIEEVEFNITGEVYIPFKELTVIKKRLLHQLNEGRDYIPPITLPKLKKASKTDQTPQLEVLISDANDIQLMDGSDAKVYFQLPNSFKDNVATYADLFQNNSELIPWFPALLIGDDYTAAIKLLAEVKPNSIVTNNTGIAYEAYQRNIDWIAGPQLNITNSYSLQNLKESFNCKGAFISNELSKQQILGIKAPEDFELHYTIFQSITLMTSRQCFFHQVSGCAKHLIDGTCIAKCEKEDRIRNLKGESFVIEKSKGNYHRVFNESPLLNTTIATDLGHRFHSMCVDLSELKSKADAKTEKTELIQLFEQHLKGVTDATEQLHAIISPSNNTQYTNGI